MLKKLLFIFTLFCFTLLAQTGLVRFAPEIAARGLVKRVEPTVPPLATSAGVGGTVVGDLTISVEGKVRSVTIISGHPLLIEGFLEATKQWEYKPFVLNGNPVEAITRVEWTVPTPSSTGQGSNSPDVQTQAVAPAIQQAITGTTYENRTAHFRLTVPEDWFVSESLMKTVPGIVGTLAAQGGSPAIMIQRYYVPGVKAGAQILDAQWKKGFQDYRKLEEGSLKIDGKDSYFFVVRWVMPFGPPEDQVPMPAELLVVLVPDGESVLGFLCQANEGEFENLRPGLERIVTSFEKDVQLTELPRSEATPGMRIKIPIVVNEPKPVPNEGPRDESEVFHIGGGVTGPELIQSVHAEYPKEKRDAKIEGDVELSAVVQRDGTVRDVKVTKSLDPLLDQNALEAVRQWRFKPGMKGKTPVNVFVTLEIAFRMLPK